MMPELTKQFIDLVVNEVNKPEHKNRIKQEVLGPCSEYLGEKIYPYILAAGSMMLVLFILLMFITLKIVKL